MSERKIISGWASAGAAVVLLAGVASSTAACNAITGAGDLSIVTGGDSSGDGGAGSVGGTGDATTGAGVMCEYPKTGYGNKIGSVIPPTKKWQGYAEHADMVSTISIADYLDCDGSKNINALLIDESAVWCGACNQEAAEMNSLMANKWEGLGIHVLTLMIDDATQGQPATTKTALNWKTKYKLDATAVGVDTSITFAPPGAMTIGLPLQIIVDPRTMTLVEVQEGFSGDYTTLENLAKKNQAGM
jgi:hypothetical protein